MGIDAGKNVQLMQFGFNYTTFVKATFAVLLLAAIGNSHILTLGESARLLAIVLGLGFLYLRFGRQGSDVTVDTTVLCHGVSLIALILTFILVQFDPPFARINELAPQKHLNWFFALSSGAVIVGFAISCIASYVAIPERGIRAWWAQVWGSWSGFDRVVLVTIIAVIVFMFVVDFIFPQDAREIQIFGAIKLGLCMLVYLNVLVVFRLLDIDRTKQNNIASSIRNDAGLSLAYKTIIGIFCLILLLGGFKYVSAYFEQKQGHRLIEQEEYRKAITVLESALKKTGYHSEKINVALGHAYLGIGQRAEAEKYFNSARRTEMDSRTVDKSIGDVYMLLGLWDQAIAAYKQARIINTDPLYVFEQLSLAYLEKGERYRLIELIQAHDRVPVLQLDTVAELVGFGVSLAYMGRYDAAEKQLDQALRLDAADALVYYGQGLLKNRKQEWEQASVLLEKALALDSMFVQANYELGVAYKNLGQEDLAFPQFMKVVALQPDNLLALGSLVNSYKKKERHEQAEQIKKRMQVLIAPSDWKGPHGGQLAWGGGCWYEAEFFKGEIEITVQASGTPASDIWPIMEIFIDKKKVGSASVIKGGTYTFKTKVEESGYHKLLVAFVNDSTSNDVGDRNLFVGQAKIRYLRVD